MSTAARLISGSVASWAQIGVTMAAQIVLVPIYLSHWNVKTYGIWLAIQGIMNVLSMLDLGYQNFMAYEFLRIGRKDILVLSKYLWSGIIVGTLLALTQILLIVLLLSTGALTFLLGESGTTDVDLIDSAGIALVLQGIVWLIVMTFGGLMSRVLSPFGYYPRMAWWTFLYAILTALAPLAAVVMGADLLVTSIVLTLAALAYCIPFYSDIFKLFKKERIKFLKPSLSLGYSNFRKSVPLLGKALLENVRQQGVRLVLAPLVGPVGLAAFSTMRTGANVALQGLNTIINPLIPDLMRFLHDRDQPRSEAAFATVWIVVVAFMAPGVVILQTFVEPLYTFWTQGKITFDPLLFAVLSLGVLVYAVVQPAMAVVIGNNLTKKQLGLAALAAVFVFGVLAVLVPIIGILGSAIALLLAEIASAVGYKIYAQRWLNQNNLLWPKRPFLLAVISVLIATGSLASMIWIPHLKWLILAISMILFIWNLWRYWHVLPTVAIERAKNVAIKIPGVKRLFFLFNP
jgi:O-antigen/teichoic acid export membrane protein